MISKIIRILIGLLGAALGTAIYIALVGILPGVFSGINDYKYIITIGVALVFGIIFYAIAPLMLSKVKEGVKLLDKEISKYPQSDILLATIGLIVGLVIAYLIVSGIGTFINLPIITAIVGILVYLFMGYIGIRIALKSRDDLFNINKLSRLTTALNKEKSSKKGVLENKIPPKKRTFFWWSFGKNFGTFMNLLIRVDSQMIIKYKTKKTPLKRGGII